MYKRQTKKFLEAQGRGDVWVPLSSDPDAEYDEEYTVDLSALEPLAAMPHMPDNVKMCIRDSSECVPKKLSI